MRVFKDMKEWQAFRSTLPKDKVVGLLATMGNLHQGHLSLLQTAREQSDIVVLSIFVNPTQFNDKNDFDRYPKTIEEDLALAESAVVDYVLLPTPDAMYSDDYNYQVSEKKLSQMMEGISRPGHFNGMLTIVLKLLLLAGAHKTFFGEKDYQQLQLVKGMVEAFFVPCEVVGCKTIREDSQLAMSSRNGRLNPEQKKLAELFAHALSTEPDIDKLTDYLNQHNIQIDYLQDYDDRRFAAVFIDDVRLIDNHPLSEILSACSKSINKESVC